MEMDDYIDPDWSLAFGVASHCRALCCRLLAVAAIVVNQIVHLIVFV